jgi:hypothetical protein
VVYGPARVCGGEGTPEPRLQFWRPAGGGVSSGMGVVEHSTPIRGVKYRGVKRRHSEALRHIVA